MPDFEALEPIMRSYALVGCFLRGWALLEGNIKQAIGKSLGLGTVQLAIVASNMQFRDKINTLRTAVDISRIQPDERKKHFKAVLQDIADYSHNRNMMAHDVFGPSPDGGVDFLVIKARGSLQVPDTVWRVQDFIEAYRKIADWTAEVDSLADELDTAALVNALMQQMSQPTTPEPGGLGLLGLLFHPPQDAPDSSHHPVTPETES